MRTLIFALLIASSVFCRAGSALLAWDPVSTTNVVIYQLKWGTESRVYTRFLNVTNSTSGLATNLDFGNWYFAVHCWINGAKSDDSNEVLWVNKPPPPGNLRITASTNSQTAMLWIPVSGGSVAAQSATSLSGPWSDWFLASHSGPPAVSEVGVVVDVINTDLFFFRTSPFGFPITPRLHP